MPILTNSRHERFAQELAAGKTADEAYGLAGFSPNRGNATRLKANESVMSRVEELQAAGAEKAEVTVQSLINEAGDIQKQALAAQQYSAAVAAMTAKAKLAGHWVEKEKMSQSAELLNRFTPDLLKSLPPEMQSEVADLVEELDRSQMETRLFQLYPDTGPLRRELYPKHLAFFRAGTEHMERACIAANRIGKTWGLGGYETALHLTGEYPDWWDGRRFDHPIDAWAAGDTSETTRDIVQLALMGQLGQLGTGLIPAANIIGEPTKRIGVAGAMDTGRIRHKSGGVSVGFKSYDQGRKKFQGTSKHVIWLDEEPPADVYDECLIRLMTVNGLLIGTFTPLLGLSAVVLRFLPDLAPEPT